VTKIRKDLIEKAFVDYKVVKEGHGLSFSVLLGVFGNEGLNGDDLMATVNAMQADGSVKYDPVKQRISRTTEA